MKLSLETIASIYDRRAVEVLRYLGSKTCDADVAVDLLAETFARAITDRRRFRGNSEDEVVGWIFAIARNQLNDFWRKGRSSRVALRRLGTEPPAMSADEYERIERLLDLAAVRKRVAAELDDLSEVQRDAVRLRVIEERSYPEVAAALGTTEQTARARVSRALSVLRATAVIQELQGEQGHVTG